MSLLGVMIIVFDMNGFKDVRFDCFLFLVLVWDIV